MSNHRGYPSTSANIRTRLEGLTALPDDSKEWTAFIRDEMHLPAWTMPALQTAVRQGKWRAATDPVAHLTSAVHRLAIEMRLSKYDRSFDPAAPVSED